MKGKVEVFSIHNGERSLIFEENNLIMDGAGETIVDMLTTTSSIALSGTDTFSTVLDASNYIIQGLAFGKGSEGYTKNAHSYRKHNLLAYSEETLSGANTYVDFSNVTSKKAFTKHSIDASSNVYKLENIFSDGGTVIWNQHNVEELYLSSLSSCPKIFSIDVKLDLQNPPKPASDGFCRIRIVQQHENQSRGCIFKFRPPSTALSSSHPGTFEGFDETDNGNRSYVKSLGNGWYRLACVFPDFGAGLIQQDQFSYVVLYPVGDYTKGSWDADASGGSLLVSRPSYNIGSVPIEYYIGDANRLLINLDSVNFPFMPSSVITSDETGFYMVSSGGTLSKNVDGYDVVASLPDMPNPDATKLQSNTITDYEKATALNINYGHNVNIGAFYGKAGFSVSSYIDPSWAQAEAVKILPIQKDLKWVSPYQAAEVINVGLLSAIDGAGYSTPYNTKDLAYNDGYNSTSSMDINGYVRVFYPTLGESDNVDNRVVCTSESDFSSTGKVKFTTKMSQHDRIYTNFFGGIFQLGLYTMDINLMRRSGNLEAYTPINKDAVTGDDLLFRLFASKSLGFDLTYLGQPDYLLSLNRELEINWTVDFL